MTRYGNAIAGAIATLLVVPFVRAAAQARVALAAGLPGAIVVQVTDTSLNPLPAEVALPQLGVALRLGEEGTLTLANVPDGLYLVEVRHDAHAPDARLLRVSGDTARFDFVLSPANAEGDRARGPRATGMAQARFHYFVARSAEISSGVFITRIQIERRAPRTVSALLRDVQGVRIQRGSGGRTIVRSTLAPHAGCADGMAVFLDGAVLTTDVGRVAPSSIAAVEIYSSPGSAPPEFRLPGTQCGVVLIWTAASRM